MNLVGDACKTYLVYDFFSYESNNGVTSMILNLAIIFSVVSDTEEGDRKKENFEVILIGCYFQQDNLNVDVDRKIMSWFTGFVLATYFLMTSA